MGLWIRVVDGAKRNGLPIVRMDAPQDHRVIAYPLGSAINWMELSAVSLEISFGARNEENAGLVQAVQSLAIKIATVLYLVFAGLRQQQVKEIDVVYLLGGDTNKARNIYLPIQQRMRRHGRFRRTKRRLREERQTPIVRGRVERVNRLGQFHVRGYLRIQAALDANQTLRKTRLDTPIVRIVEIHQCIAGNVAAHSQVFKLRGLGAKTLLDVPPTLSPRELGDGRAQLLVEAQKALDAVLPCIVRYAPPHGRQRKMPHQLREGELNFMHLSSPRRGMQIRCARANRRSNPDQGNTAELASCSTT